MSVWRASLFLQRRKGDGKSCSFIDDRGYLDLCRVGLKDGIGCCQPKTHPLGLGGEIGFKYFSGILEAHSASVILYEDRMKIWLRRNGDSQLALTFLHCLDGINDNIKEGHFHFFFI